ncbi:hypothetical protein PsorP6_004638 [Peronosclerospora sorghi]|uniref:Uncharacterized protein n=1 Tax=Peronosclerospora sorghi TaxID=230839 RepID=A0ACC0VL50_9STRA|nr:hypothetical protein PsorP6_004638 [Peronosclerospora sorghi]
MDAAMVRAIELLVPMYPEVCQVSQSIPVFLQYMAGDWIQLVFSRPQMRKDLTCVNDTTDCGCDFMRFLKAIVALTELMILQVDATYVVASRDASVPSLATLLLHIRVHEEAKPGTLLKEYDFILCHLQTSEPLLTPRDHVTRNEAKPLEDARNSSCHVVGCQLHRRAFANTMIPLKQKFNLPDLFHSLTSHINVDQMEIRDDATYVARMARSKKQILMTDLPTSVLQNIICFANAKDVASLSGVCSLFQHIAYEVVPGLNLVLYEHQRRGLKWMLRRETRSLTCIPQPHPFILWSEATSDVATAIDLIENRVITHSHPEVTVTDACGGMFCDEPGLGKTITMLALILRTKGQTTKNTQITSLGRGGYKSRPGLRSSRSRGRWVNTDDLVSSRTSLLVVPDPLVEHWKHQIETHVLRDALHVYIDPGIDHELPSNTDLARYDVVITSFTRLAREWRFHRPTSALEERMPKRFGFEGPPRYADGTLRGHMSSLLTVYWVRVIVDEGHKLGGQNSSDLMLLARLLSSERRWVMTGTPTPNTLQSADLRYMHGLLAFLRNLPYGSPDGQAWVKAIARPFQQNELVGYHRLQHLLSCIMLRHTKQSIREVLPEPIRHTVFIDPTPSEYAQYNGVAAAVRANLVITNMDPKTPGSLHLDSLLNPINRKEALRVVSNLRSACCGGSAVKVSLAEASRLETVNMLSSLNVDGDNIAAVLDYLRKVQLQGVVTECGCCKRKLQLLMIIPCGHLCCADCVEDRMRAVGPSCFRCHAVFDRETFQKLQPGFEFEIVEDILENDDPILNQHDRRGGHVNQIQQLLNHGQRHHRIRHERRGNRRGQEANGQNSRREPRRALDLTRDIHFIDASKAFYAATRVKELKDEFVRGKVAFSERSSRRYARFLKAIIFSQFKEHIWHIKVAFAQQGVPTADFIAGLNPEKRMEQLMRFREDPNVNVLLLTEVGSHGLDLSFVTHIFLMDEIWDKSLEQQVISRAHRMGASQAVVVEQLWMRGSVESQMWRPRKADNKQTDSKEMSSVAVHVSPANLRGEVDHALARSPRRHNTGGGTMFTASSKKRKRHRTSEVDVRKTARSKKSTKLQRKLDYVLNKLRLLEENIVAEPGQVRFYVENERKEVIRRAIHVMPNRGSRGRQYLSRASALPAQTVANAPPVLRMETTAHTRADLRRVVSFVEETSRHPASDNVIVIVSSSDEESKDTDAEKQGDMEMKTLVENSQCRWVEETKIVVASLRRNDDDNDDIQRSPSKTMRIKETGENEAIAMAKAANPKARRVSFFTFDSEPESE